VQKTYHAPPPFSLWMTVGSGQFSTMPPAGIVMGSGFVYVADSPPPPPAPPAPPALLVPPAPPAPPALLVLPAPPAPPGPAEASEELDEPDVPGGSEDPQAVHVVRRRAAEARVLKAAGVRDAGVLATTYQSLCDGRGRGFGFGDKGVMRLERPRFGA
jgi:hypothetical protein